jgi:S1-C subfamily serine protease
MISIRSIAVLLSFGLSVMAHAQAPGVPVYDETKGAHPEAGLQKQCRALLKNGELLDLKKVDAQMTRKTCELKLPAPTKEKLDSRDLWKRARQSHIRVGWYDKTKKDKRLKVGLSGGFAITNDTVVTCGHVIGHDDETEEGYLIAVDDNDKVYAVSEVLAVNVATDCAILRIKGSDLTPVPLSVDVVPGDKVVCFSDPMDRRGFYAEGVVNRFIKRPFVRDEELTEAARKDPSLLESPVWLSASTDWAPGSSGSAVLDLCGNAVAHVSEIESVLEDPVDPKDATPAAKRKARAAPRGTLIIFHEGIAASNVLALIKSKP